jgi:ABC-2 type transport system permease protein
MATGGITVGLVAEEFKSLFVDNQDLLEFFGGTTNANVTDILFAGMFGFMALAIAAYTIQSLLRVRAEETAGHLEPVLATAVSRTRWLFSHLICVVAGLLVLVSLFAITTGVTYVVATDAAWSEVSHLVAAVFAYVPAVLVMAGLVYLLFGVLPRLTLAITWSALAISIFIAQFGSLLKLKQWLLDISPFSHTPTAPAEAVTATPLIILSAIAVALLIGGFVAFRQRDITTS